MSLAQLKIGTSGWIYKDWEGVFYPQGLKTQDKLKYFSQYFKTAEINYSFYHLPRPSTFQNWYKNTSKDFVFAVKVSRFITHIKRLKGVNKNWNVFWENAINLRDKLGPFLFQLPPSFKATEETIKRLEEVLRFLHKNSLKKYKESIRMRYAFEFRDKSWCNKKIYQLLKKYKIAWVIADSPNFPKREEITTGFTYLRMHGSKELFSSKYTRAELESLSQKIKNWQKRNIDVFVYFNNDAQGFAIQNARELIDIYKRE